MTSSSARLLKNYRLPDTILPLAKEREPFRQCQTGDLEKAIQFTLENLDESRGMMPHVIRQLEGREEPSNAADMVTLEAHLDATALPHELTSRIISYGFGPDPFFQFNLRHFSDHFTLKFKLAASKVARRVEIGRLIMRQCEKVYEILTNELKGGEGYIELEIYRSSNRRTWNKHLQQNWDQERPLGRCSFEVINPPQTSGEATSLKVALDIVKRADIHLKLLKGEGLRLLIDYFCELGFYHVITGSGNDVLTGQFARAQDAKKVFFQLDTFFNQSGGCAEMTLEPARKIWRTQTMKDGLLHKAALPPLIVRATSWLA